MHPLAYVAATAIALPVVVLAAYGFAWTCKRALRVARFYVRSWVRTWNAERCGSCGRLVFGWFPLQTEPLVECCPACGTLRRRIGS